MGDLQKSCEKVEISDTEKNPQSSTIETTQKPVVVTESMIRLNRRFNYATRPRPNAIAIVNPETKEVLFPGQLKVAQAEKIPETESPKAGASIEASDCSRRDSESRETQQLENSMDQSFYYFCPQSISYFDLPLQNGYFMN